MPEPFLSRLRRYGSIDSTQRVVREWLDAGTDEVCVATADEQTAGRGRQGRDWIAPAGAALLVSAGFRPAELPLRHAWCLAATCALALLDAAEDVAELGRGVLWLKWPNDVVAEGPEGALLKVAGVLGESDSVDDRVEHAIIGIGVNVDWAAEDFPRDLRGSMTSLRELAADGAVDRAALLDAWLARLEPRYGALGAGRFDSVGWSARQRTTGHQVEVELAEGRIMGKAVGVDTDTGALLVERADAPGSPQAVSSGEVVRCRIVGDRPSEMASTA